MLVAVEKITEAAGVEAGSIPDDAACYAALERLLRSQTFHKAPRLCSLLRYVAEKTLAGQLSDLTEQQIGIHVFGRTPGYNSADDTIVRGTARHLRSRLEQYYREEGPDDPIQLQIPKGGYVASFKKAATHAALPDLPSLSLETLPQSSWVEPQPSAVSWPRQAKLLVAGLVLVVLALCLVLSAHHAPHAAPVENAGPLQLWKMLFQTNRRTIIVPGDAALDSYIAWEGKQVSLFDYTNQGYQQHVTVSRPPVGMDVPLSVRSVTPMADLRLTAELVRIPTRMGEPDAEAHTEIRYARDLTVSDTRDSNLILIGAETFNPWVTLYQPQLDFKVQWDPAHDLFTVTDRAPQKGEPASLSYRRGDGTTPALTLVALVENTQGQGNVLLIEGTSMGTTYSALTFLTSERLWRQVLQRVVDTDGRVHPFEVLLSNEFVRGGATNTHVLSIHAH